MLLMTCLKNLVTWSLFLPKDLNTTYVLCLFFLWLWQFWPLLCSQCLSIRNIQNSGNGHILDITGLVIRWTFYLDDMHDIVFTQAWETSQFVSLNSEWWHLYRKDMAQ
jgi:hypothetical protein